MHLRNVGNVTNRHGVTLFEVIGTVAAHAATVPMTSNNDICNRSQHCNFSDAQAESSLMMVYGNRNMLEQLLQF